MKSLVMNKFVVFSVGAIVGVALTFVFLRQETKGNPCVECVSRDFLVDSSIDAIDSIQSGDIDTAQVLLAGAVNSQIIVIRKMKSSSAEDKMKSEEWSKLMQKHNDRLGLRIPEPKKP